MLKINKQHLLYIALAQAVIATLGSLYFSLVLGWKPCTLCWYQRLAMYPIIPIIAIGLIKKIKHLKYYVLPFGFIGFSISIYQNLLQFGVIDKFSTTCSLNNPCVNNNYVLGFINLPILSSISFMVIIICFLLIKENE